MSESACVLAALILFDGEAEITVRASGSAREAPWRWAGACGLQALHGQGGARARGARVCRRPLLRAHTPLSCV